MTTGPVTRCVPCGREVRQVGQMWFHGVGREATLREACLVDNCYRLERIADPEELHCDFCNEQVQAEDCWAYITSRGITADVMVYQEDTLEIKRTQTHDLTADWCACNNCKLLIEDGAWEQLSHRTLSVMGHTSEYEHYEEIRGMVLELWAEMSKGFVEWRRGTIGDER